MSSPFPEDPYVALGLSKEADLGQIRSAHRKLVLKYHPDRIKGDDAEAKTKAKDEFQKVQQAYELLSDPSRRSRYDDQIKLAELQREKMAREASRPTGHTRASSTSQTTFVRREMRKDGHLYEERAPPTSYFDDRDMFDEPVQRSTSRKHEPPYEKERKPSVAKTAEKKEKVSSKSATPVEAFTMKASANLKAKATAAKERVHAKSQETRDREKRRERSDKHAGRRHPHVEDGVSDSDSDTVVQSKPEARSTRTSPPRKPESEYVKVRPPPVRRPAYYEDESFDEDDKSVRDHFNARSYIAESQKRPSMGSRKGSDAHVYWGGDYTGPDVNSGRHSDSEKTSNPRRTKAGETRTRPSMPGQNSAPGNLRSFVNMEDRAPQSRAKTNPYPSEREARPTPNLNRSQTMPVNRSAKTTSAPTHGSKLKHSETQDSGYYSSSNPVTPEMKSESPPPTRENSKKKGSNSTKYQIVTPEVDDDTHQHRVKILESDDENRHRRYNRSPEPETRREKDRDRERERERERGRDKDAEKARDRVDRERPRERERPIRADSDSRTRTGRDSAPTSYPRGDFVRHDPSSPRGSPPHSRGKTLFGEISSDEKEVPYNYRFDPNTVKRAHYQAPATAGYGDLRFRSADIDYAPKSSFTTQTRYNTSRRPSAAY